MPEILDIQKYLLDRGMLLLEFAWLTMLHLRPIRTL